MQMRSNSYEIYHHGILGQHWGIRRYQNEDGSLTKKGEKRFKQVYKSEKEQKKVQKEATKILSKTIRKDEKKLASITKKVSKINNKDMTSEKLAKLNVQKKYITSQEKLAKTRLNKINSNKAKAGQDYVTTTDSLKIPYAYVFLTGPKIGVLKIPKSQLVFKD